MKKIFGYLILLVLISTNTSFKEKPAGCLQMDIMLIGDFSMSVMNHEKFVSDAFMSFANKFQLSESSVKIGVVTFGEDAEVISELTSNVVELSKGLSYMGRKVANASSTNIASGFYKAVEQFDKNGREGYKKIMIIVSDGQFNDGDNPIMVADHLKALDIGIFGVLINNGSNSPETMKLISSEFCYLESNYENLLFELQRLDICM